MNNSPFHLNQVATSLFALCLCTFISGCSCQSSTESEETEGIEEAEKFPADGYVNGHGYVDLGLSVKWAICNIGAESPTDYGAYCAINYHPSKLRNVYLLYDSANDIEAINNMVTNSEGERIVITVGDCMYEYDGGDLLNVALFADCEDVRAYWGEQWRLPTGSEISELVSQCRWKYTEQGGHRGYEVIGPNGNSIFLPTTGYFDGWSSPYDTKSYGYYLSGIKYNKPQNPKIPSTKKCSPFYGPQSPGNKITLTRPARVSGYNHILNGWSGMPDALIGNNNIFDGFIPKFNNIPYSSGRPQNDTTFLYGFQFDKNGQWYGAWNHYEILLPIRPVLKQPTENVHRYITGYINGHEYVDLGLSVKWATCNIGADFPDDLGNYFSENNQYDAATSNWGGIWRTPTQEEMNELMEKCEWVIATWSEIIDTYIITGNLGYKVIGPNGNSIFIPILEDSSPNGISTSRNSSLLDQHYIRPVSE